MIDIRSVAFGIVAVATFAASAAEAKTCPSISLTVQQVSGQGYDPSDYTDTPVELRIRSATGRLPLACLLVPITISPQGSQAFPFVLNNGPSVLESDFDASLAAFRLVRSIRLTPLARAKIVAGEAVTLTVGEIDPGQFQRSGNYSAIVDVEAGAAVQAVTLSTEVRPVFKLQRSSADGIESIDLGDPRSGASGSTAFFYRSNADVALSVTSEHGGKLLHADGASTQIAYTASVAGQPLALTGGGPVDVSLPFANLAIQSRTVAVTVPPTGPIYAGQYRDTLTLTFTPY